MKKLIKVAVLPMMLAMMFAVSAFSASMDVTVDKVVGTVEAKAASGAWTAVQSGDIITEGSTVRTKADSSCVLKWAAGNVAKVAALSIVKVSEVQILDSGDEQSALSLEQGKVFAHAKKLASPNSKFELRTPTAVAGVRGTDEYATFGGGQSSFGCAGGAIEVTTPGGDSAVLETGFSVGVDMNGAMGDIVPIPDNMMNEVNQNTRELREESKKEEQAASQKPEKKQEKKAQKEEKKEEKKAEKEEKKAEKEEKKEEKAASKEEPKQESKEEAKQESAEPQQASSDDSDSDDSSASDGGADVPDAPVDTDEITEQVTDNVNDNIDQILDDDTTDNIIDDIESQYRTGTVEVEIYLNDSAQ